MTLDQYLTQNNISEEVFGDQIGRTQQAVNNYRKGRKPRDDETMRAIVMATNGQVTANDFYNLADNSHIYPQMSTPAEERQQ